MLSATRVCVLVIEGMFGVPNVEVCRPLLHSSLEWSVTAFVSGPNAPLPGWPNTNGIGGEPLVGQSGRFKAPRRANCVDTERVYEPTTKVVLRELSH